MGLCNNPIMQSKYYTEWLLIAECANLRLSASEASGQHRDPWQFIVETKNSVKNAENFQQCAILEPLYNKVRTHFITQSRWLWTAKTINLKIVWTSANGARRRTDKIGGTRLFCHASGVNLSRSPQYGVFICIWRASPKNTNCVRERLQQACADHFMITTAGYLYWRGGIPSPHPFLPPRQKQGRVLLGDEFTKILVIPYWSQWDFLGLPCVQI